MRSKLLLIFFAITMAYENAFAGKAAETIAGALLFLPGMILEEYLASLFDEKGAVQESSNYIFIPYIKTEGIHSDYERYIIQTFAQYVKDIGRYKLKAADKDNLYNKSASVEITNTIAKKRGCRSALYISVAKKNYGTLFKFVMKDTEDNSILWHDEYTALIPEDIAPILFRVANTMGTGKIGSNPKSFYDNDNIVYIDKDNLAEIQQKQQSQPTVEEQQQEENSIQYTDSKGYYGLSLYGDLLFSKIHPMVGVGFNAWIDFGSVVTEADLEIHTKTSKEKSSLTLLGANLWFPLFRNKSNTPYLGGGAGYSFSFGDQEESNSGCTVSIGGGYMFNRFKSVFFKIGLKYLQNFYVTDGDHRNSLGIELTVGI